MPITNPLVTARGQASFGQDAACELTPKILAETLGRLLDEATRAVRVSEATFELTVEGAGFGQYSLWQADETSRTSDREGLERRCQATWEGTVDVHR